MLIIAVGSYTSRINCLVFEVNSSHARALKTYPCPQLLGPLSQWSCWGVQDGWTHRESPPTCWLVYSRLEHGRKGDGRGGRRKYIMQAVCSASDDVVGCDRLESRPRVPECLRRDSGARRVRLPKARNLLKLLPIIVASPATSCFPHLSISGAQFYSFSRSRYPVGSRDPFCRISRPCLVRWPSLRLFHPSSPIPSIATTRRHVVFFRHSRFQRNIQWKSFWHIRRCLRLQPEQLEYWVWRWLVRKCRSFVHQWSCVSFAFRYQLCRRPGWSGWPGWPRRLYVW